ncbi:MAG: hypothetical protein U1A78_18300 [Polyangia bacterium]
MALPPPPKPELKSGAAKPAEKPAPSSGAAASKPAGKPTVAAAGPAPGPVAKEGARAALRPLEKPPERAPERAAAKVVLGPAPSSQEKGPARPVDRPADKPADRPADKTAQRAAEPPPPSPPPPRGAGRGGSGGSGERGELTTVLRGRIVAEARRFSIPALLDLLHAMGYRDEEIEYRSYQSQRPQPALLHSVEFLEPVAPPPGRLRTVLITVNIGLLTAQTPLPSYVMKILDQQDASGMAEFLAFFDHHLLRDRFQALYPERNRGLFVDWEETKAKLLRMLGLESPSTMYWLFQHVYPELGLVVRRGQQQMPLNALGALLGEAVLGERYTLGGIAQVPVGGMEITLCAEEPQSPAGLPWAQEAARRLREQILPLLRGVDLQLTVFLLFVEHTEWARLVHEQYLGFEPIRDDGQRARPQLVLLWRGDARTIE